MHIKWLNFNKLCWNHHCAKPLGER